MAGMDRPERFNRTHRRALIASFLMILLLTAFVAAIVLRASWLIVACLGAPAVLAAAYLRATHRCPRCKSPLPILFHLRYCPHCGRQLR